MLIVIAAFIGVTALVGGLAMILLDKSHNRMEDRLDLLTGAASPSSKPNLLKEGTILSQPLDAVPGIFETFFERFGNVNRLFEQADTSLTVGRLVAISAVLAVAGCAVGVIIGIHAALLPVVGLVLGSLPLVWVLLRRRKRLRVFGAQLPEALEMLSRSLRAGQSLPFGFNMAASEIGPPLGKEFGRVFEEQNLGVPLDESLQSMTDRIPNLDLKFFVTAVILQRQTGGDLAEILDKIGSLIRERFRIWGQVQALTGEGRLSGIVLMALPVVLFVALYQLNPDYVMVLFTDELGNKMLAAAVFMQVIGALVIKKIVTIKV